MGCQYCNTPLHDTTDVFIVTIISQNTTLPELAQLKVACNVQLQTIPYQIYHTYSHMWITPYQIYHTYSHMWITPVSTLKFSHVITREF